MFEDGWSLTRLVLQPIHHHLSGLEHFFYLILHFVFRYESTTEKEIGNDDVVRKQRTDDKKPAHSNCRETHTHTFDPNIPSDPSHQAMYKSQQIAQTHVCVKF